MRIAVDATAIGAAGATRGGVYQYVLQLLRQLARLDPDGDYRLLFGLARSRHRAAIATALAAIGPQRWKLVRAPLPDRWSRRAHLPIDLWLGSVDVFHAPAHLGSLPWRGAGVVTAHDLSYRRDRAQPPRLDLLDADARRAWSRRRRFFADLESGMERTLRSAVLVIANSQHTARSLSAELGVPASKIRVTHLAVRDEIAHVSDPERMRRVRERHGLSEPYGLYVGTLDPNKNLETLLEGFARYRARGGAAVLALAGTPGWYGALLRGVAARLGDARDVRFLGAVSDEDLGALLSGALWSAAPSPLEGFCIPALEAMACRTPLIAANGGALPEIAGPAALLVDPGSAEAFADAMERLAEEKSLRASLVEAGVRRAAEFSWERTALQTLQVYREAARLHGGERVSPRARRAVA